jgi:nicotinamidase/pyrazinamidase
MKNPFQTGDALLVVDAQVDFFPGGALPVAGSNTILPVINAWIQAAEEKGIPIFFSRDWHPANHCSFKEYGGLWPRHCVQNSVGASIHPQIALPQRAIMVDKAQNPEEEAYSVFQAKTRQGIPFDSLLKEKKITRLWVSGLAEDYCVFETILDARKKDYAVRLILKGTKPISKEGGQTALFKLQAAGVMMEPSSLPTP